MESKEHEARKRFLVEIFGATGLLAGTDVVTGENYQAITPVDVVDYMDAHLRGPGRRTRGAEAMVRGADGERKMVTSFFRTTLRPYSREGSTRAIAIEVTGQFSLEPTAVVTTLVDWLRERGIEPVVERSFRLARWTVWIYLTEWMAAEDVRLFIGRLYAEGVDRGVISTQMRIPCLEPDPSESMYLPFQFFAGDYFGQLYRVAGEKMMPLDLSAVPLLDLSTGAMQLADFQVRRQPSGLTDLVKAWAEELGGRAARAGELLDLADSRNIEITGFSRGSSRQARTIEMGNLLLQSVGTEINSLRLRARRSGNSNVFELAN